MKRISMFAIIAISIIASSNAQEFKLGARAGVNLSSIGGDDTGGVGGLTAFHAGLVMEIQYSDKFSFQPEILYSGQGYTNEFSKTTTGITRSLNETVTLDYVSVPLLAKYFFAKGFSVEAGPQLAYLISAKREFVETVSGGFNASESGSEDYKDSTKSFDYGAALGFSYQIGSGTIMSARYYLGLANIVDIEASDLKRQNNVIQISVGFMLD
ncbi:PorT family protein [Subsaximicrobium wynnwilliamsii]|uniref:PorT family protein n=1 Tax=Subsaximicrobium wynnwilliamsii TaxID=291179 RepID=A0A5C6ZRD0_9FLAO|nr:porin family protein [Subsaximicrobium wynnwilliamsii]TXD85107.1 PorT family protein [Subsaximicrobium wynnwilliamsii]TXD91150.1 PorT family protein [Subsaximicrobium wynnwilliamsii]TXE04544.1 PorT family protein [Subsaximicrobium wynnwilliamsii]